MKGINFVTDENDRKVAVQIDLKVHEKLWGDFYDNLVAEQRKNEEKIPLNELISSLKEEGKLDELLGDNRQQVGRKRTIQIAQTVQ